MNINSAELQEFISSAIKSIQSGVKTNQHSHIIGNVKFRLAIVNSQEGGGGIKIYVANANGKISKEEISIIEFDVDPNYIETPSGWSPPKQTSYN